MLEGVYVMGGVYLKDDVYWKNCGIYRIQTFIITICKRTSDSNGLKLARTKNEMLTTKNVWVMTLYQQVQMDSIPGKMHKMQPSILWKSRNPNERTFQ